jgi:hypothetical protein
MWEKILLQETGTLIKLKNADFWDVVPCRYCVNRRFGGVTCSRWFLSRGFLYLEDGGDMFSRNVGLHNIYTAPIPEGGILHSHRRENLKSYQVDYFFYLVSNL